MSSLRDRLAGRKLVQWSVAYLASAWVTLQIVDLLRETFEWSAVVQRAALVVLAVGFLCALVLAWYHGERGMQRVTGPELVILAALARGSARGRA